MPELTRAMVVGIVVLNHPVLIQAAVKESVRSMRGERKVSAPLPMTLDRACKTSVETVGTLDRSNIPRAA